LNTVRAHLLREGLRAARYALVLSVLALVVGALSDEGGVSFPIRVARVLPATAVAAGAAALWARSRAARIGELRTYAACGGNPRALGWAWTIGGAAVGLLCAGLLCMGLSVEGFLPPLQAAPAFTLSAEGFRSDSLGVLIHHGTMTDINRVPDHILGGPIAPPSYVWFYLACVSIALGALGGMPEQSGLSVARAHSRVVRSVLLGLLGVLTLLLCAAHRLPNVAILGLGLGSLALALQKSETPAR
jgi:hypothetical protein